MKQKSLQKALSLVLSLLLLVGLLPILPQARAETAAIALPDAIFSDAWNGTYDVLYHEAGKTYTSGGASVTFPDPNTVRVGTTDHAIRNRETTVTTVTENGKTTVTFSDLATPVGSVSGKWNSGFNGQFSLHYRLNGKAVKSAVTDRINTQKLVIDTAEPGTYTLTGGKIYEAANEWSPGLDFGSGVVTSREFGYLPDVTIVIPGEAGPAAPELTAMIGDEALTVTEVENPSYMCGLTHTFEVAVPDALKDEPITLGGVDGYYYRAVPSAMSCWGGTAPLEGPVTANEFGYHFLDLDGLYAEDYANFHVIFRILPVPAPELTARIGDTALTVTEVENPSYMCGLTHTFEVAVPEALKDEPITLGGVDGYYYRAVPSAMSCWGGTAPLEGPVTANEFGYHFLDLDGLYAEDYANFHVIFEILPPPAVQLPISAKIGDTELAIEEIENTGYFCNPLHTYVISVPESLQDQEITFTGTENYTYRTAQSATACWGSLTEPFPQTVPVTEFAYHLYDVDGVYDPDLASMHLTFRIVPDTVEPTPAVTVAVTLTAQQDGSFLLAPRTEAEVAAGLAGLQGYVYDEAVGEEDVTALDALVKMHQLIYKTDDVTGYLAVSDQGWITKAFGQELSVGYAVNGVMPSVVVNACKLAAGDHVELFNYQDTTSWSDKYAWIEIDGLRAAEYTVAAGADVQLTLRTADYDGNVLPVAGAQLAKVKADGAIQVYDGLITDAQGRVTLPAIPAGTLGLTFVSTEASGKLVMPYVSLTAANSLVTVRVEARTLGLGDLAQVQLPWTAEANARDLLNLAAQRAGLSVVYSEDGKALLQIGAVGSRGTGHWTCWVDDTPSDQLLEDIQPASGSTLRLRYALTSAADELNAPLFAHLEKAVADAEQRLQSGSDLESSRAALVDAVAAARDLLANPAYNSKATDKELAVSAALRDLNNGLAALIPDQTAASDIPADFENDLWLQYDFKELTVGDTATIYPRRIPQIIDNFVSNTITRPNFNFEVVTGNSVSLDTNDSTDRAVVTAVQEGVTVIQVTYDAIGDYGPSSPVNTAYVVFDVNNHPANLTIPPVTTQRSYDTLYYTDELPLTMEFEVQVPGAEEVSVTFNLKPLTPDASGTYTAVLENRSNIVGVTATDAEGRTRSLYQVVDARKIQIHVDNVTHPGADLVAGDTARIHFTGITMPVVKLATIYNPTFGYEGSTRVVYKNALLGTFEGACGQYDLATDNDFNVTFDTAGDYTFTDGHIFCSWWGSPLGTDKTMYGKGEPNLNAEIVSDNFSTLPPFTVTVKAPVDLTALQTLVDTAGLKQETDFTAGTWTPFSNALTHAGEVLADADATQQEVDAAVTALTAAMNNLVRRGDKTALTAALEEAGALEEAAYTPDTWKPLAAAVTAAEAVQADLNATQQEADAAVTALTAAVNNLVRKADKTALAQTVAAAKTCDEDDYTPGSWKPFREALIAAQAVLDNPNADQHDADHANSILRSAMNALERPAPVLPITPHKPRPVQPVRPPFRDVNDSDWFADAVEYVYDNGLMNGLSATEFGPNVSTSRGMIVTILYRLEREPAAAKTVRFSDVSPDAWYADAVRWAGANGIVEGMGDGTFAPDQEITREQLAAILYRYARYKGYSADAACSIDGFSDAARVSAWAEDAMEWCYGSGLLTGMEHNTLVPQGRATRAQVAAILMRFDLK